VSNKIKMWLAIALCSGSLGSAPTKAEEMPACAAITEIKSKSRPLFDGATLMISLLMLEKQGEADFRPKYAPPASTCLLEKFDVAGTSVNAVYAPFEKGEQQTLHYRFAAQSADEAREVLVVYDSMASVTYGKGDVFLVIENRKGNISYYAMFREQPTYVAIKPIVTSIIDGSAKPLAAVHWPPGAKEPVIDAYDAKRLK
jgi:hypothetical protein